MRKAEHEEMAARAKEAMRRHGHEGEVTYHHGITHEAPVNALQAIEGMEDK